MKAFRFRLDSALRWRSAQLRLEQEAAARITGQIVTLQAELTVTYSELRSGATELTSVGSAAFESWSAYVERSKRRILAIDDHLRLAKKSLATQMQKVVEVHQKVRVLENLKREGYAEWARELNRETEAFADEAFTAKLLRARLLGASREQSAEKRISLPLADARGSVIRSDLR